MRKVAVGSCPAATVDIDFIRSAARHRRPRKGHLSCLRDWLAGDDWCCKFRHYADACGVAMYAAVVVVGGQDVVGALGRQDFGRRAVRTANSSIGRPRVADFIGSLEGN